MLLLWSLLCPQLPWLVLLVADPSGSLTVVGSGRGASGGGNFCSGNGSVQLSFGLDAGGFLVQRRLGVRQRLAVQAGVHRVQGVHVPLGADGVLDGVCLRTRYVPQKVRVPEVSPRLKRRVHLGERPPPRRGPFDVGSGQGVKRSVLRLGKGARPGLNRVVCYVHSVHAVAGSEGIREPPGAKPSAGDVAYVERVVERGSLVPSALVPRLPAGLCPLCFQF